MLKEENLKGIEGLTPDQITAIVTLSKNDEEAVIGAKIGEIYGNLEKDINTVTGRTKNSGEKAYDFLKRTLTEFKDSATGAKEALGSLTSKYEALKAEAKKGGDAATLQQLEDLKGQLTAMQEQHEGEKAKILEEKDKLSGTLQAVKLDGEFSKALSAFKFKDAYPAEAVKQNVAAAKMALLNEFKPEFTESGALQFRDAEGNLVKDKTNAINPAGLESLLKTRLGYMLAEESQGGAGAGGKGSRKAHTLTIADAKTQVQADALIKQELLSQGLVSSSEEFRNKFTEVRKDLGVGELPVR